MGMNIFGWGGASRQTVDNLKKEIIGLNNTLTDLRDEKISAQISESRAQSGFNAQQESDRAENEIKIARVEGELTELRTRLQKTVNENVFRITEGMDTTYAKNLKAAKAELRAEFEAKLKKAESEAESSNKDAMKYKGMYDGALIVIKSLENQNKEAFRIADKLVSALPTVKVDTKQGDQNVTVNK